MHDNQKYFQAVGDAIIPILGYFFWSWNLYFIVLFYLLDLIASEVFMHLKSKKILQTQGGKISDIFTYSILSFALLGFSIFVIHASMQSIIPGISFEKEIMAFWSYKDLGIEQGYILIPLLYIVGYQRFKMDFLAQNHHKKTTINALWRAHILENSLLLAILGLVFGITFFWVFSERVYLVGLILITTAYRIYKK